MLSSTITTERSGCGGVRDDDDSEFTEDELPSYGLPYLDDMLMVEFTV